MKTHRLILIISIVVAFISLPFLIIFDNGKIYELALALLSSSIISFLLELPNYYSLKNENKQKIYNSLLYAKINANYLVNNIENIKKSNMPLFDKFYTENVNTILMNLYNLDTYDTNYYIRKNKNENIKYIKSNLRSAWNNINLASLHYSIDFNKLQLIKIQNNTPNYVYYVELEDDIKLIVDACENFINDINTAAKLTLTKKQFEIWNIDNMVLSNNNINSIITNN